MQRSEYSLRMSRNKRLTLMIVVEVHEREDLVDTLQGTERVSEGDAHSSAVGFTFCAVSSSAGSFTISPAKVEGSAKLGDGRLGQKMTNQSCRRCSEQS